MTLDLVIPQSSIMDFFLKFLFLDFIGVQSQKFNPRTIKIKYVKDKVLEFKKTLSELNIKLSYLESELKDMKKENIAKSKVDDEVIVSKNTEDVMEVKTSLKEVADKVKEISKDDESSKAVQSDDKFLQCDQCDYKCKKSIFLKKHTNSKHQEQECKQCKEKFSSSVKLLKHEADKLGNKLNKIPSV